MRDTPSRPRALKVVEGHDAFADELLVFHMEHLVMSLRRLQVATYVVAGLVTAQTTLGIARYIRQR